MKIIFLWCHVIWCLAQLTLQFIGTAKLSSCLTAQPSPLGKKCHLISWRKHFLLQWYVNSHSFWILGKKKVQQRKVTLPVILHYMLCGTCSGAGFCMMCQGFKLVHLTTVTTAKPYHNFHEVYYWIAAINAVYLQWGWLSNNIMLITLTAGSPKHPATPATKLRHDFHEVYHRTAAINAVYLQWCCLSNDIMLITLQQSCVMTFMHDSLIHQRTAAITQTCFLLFQYATQLHRDITQDCATLVNHETRYWHAFGNDTYSHWMTWWLFAHCEDFEGKVQHFTPHLRFLKKIGDQLVHTSSILCQDGSTVAQQAETSVVEGTLMWEYLAAEWPSSSHNSRKFL